MSDHLERIKDDLNFLLTFVPARRPEQVENGLAPMFYVTGSYEGDLKLAKRVEEICNRYGLEEVSAEEEDFEEVE